MSVLNFPMVNQNTTITSDGRPSENAQEDCVAASICAMCMYINGVTQVDHDKYNPDKFKDMAYGEALRNSGTAAIKYAPYCQSLGVKLWSLDGDYPYLIQQAHAYLAKGLPVLFTQDDWIVDTSLPQYQGWTHVAVWYRDDTPSTLTSMDPWGGFPRMKSDAAWINLLRANQIWIAEPLQPSSQGEDMLQLTDPMGTYFTQIDTNHWHCKATNVDLIYAHLDFYRQHQGIFGLPRTNEIRLASMPETAIVVYERAIACYDPNHKYDNPPGSQSVYLMHTDNGGVGQQIVAKPLIAALQAQVDDLNKQIIGLNAELANSKDNSALDALNTQLASYQEAIRQVDGIIHPLA